MFIIKPHAPIHKHLYVKFEIKDVFKVGCLATSWAPETDYYQRPGEAEGAIGKGRDGIVTAHQDRRGDRVHSSQMCKAAGELNP